MRDLSAFALLSFWSHHRGTHPQQQHPQQQQQQQLMRRQPTQLGNPNTVTSRALLSKRYYSLIPPDVWKLLEPKPKNWILDYEKDDDDFDDDDEDNADGDTFTPTYPVKKKDLTDSGRSWYRSAYPAMFESWSHDDDYDYDEVNKGHAANKNAVLMPMSTMPQMVHEKNINAARRSQQFQTTKNSNSSIRPWCGIKYYSDLIVEGLEWLNSQGMSSPSSKRNLIMMFESPTSPLSALQNERPTTLSSTFSSSFSFQSSSSSSSSSFCNNVQFPIHDYPYSGLESKTVLGPLRYACMTGHGIETFLRHKPPPGLVDHWLHAIPNFVPPKFSHAIPNSSKTICAYVPLEKYSQHHQQQQQQQQQHFIDPHVHYELGGKDCIPRMTRRTTRLFPNTRTVRPCVVKVTHAMGSRGIFVIRNDEDEWNCFQSLQEAGRPPHVVTDFVNIRRSLAAHFFIHPSDDIIIWFGTSENLVERKQEGGTAAAAATSGTVCSEDATIWNMEQQEKLQKLMTPYVQDVAQYCRSRGYWGPCGIDVLFDHLNRGFVVDVNPRVTGTCPALMVFTKLNQPTTSTTTTRISADHPFPHGTFRRNSKHHAFPGTAQDLLRQVHDFNNNHNHNVRIVIFSLLQKSPTCTLLNIAVYGPSKHECDQVLNQFAPKINIINNNNKEDAITCTDDLTFQHGKVVMFPMLRP